MTAKRRVTWKTLSMEFVAGLFFFAALGVLMVFTVILSRENLFSKKARLDVRFAGVSGLSEGDPVLVRGVPLGRVEEFRLVDTAVDVSLVLDHPLELFEGYSIEVRYSSVLGGRHVYIEVGDRESEPVSVDRILRGTAPPDLMNETARMVKAIEEQVNSIKQRFEEEEVLANVAAVLKDMRIITDAVRSGKGTIGKLVNDDSLHKEAETALGVIREAGDGVKTAATDIREIARSLQKGEGTLGKLMTDPALYDDAKGVVADLRKGKGTLGKLLVEDGLHKNLEQTLANLSELSERLRTSESTLGKLMHDGGELYAHAERMMDSITAVGDDIRSGKGTIGRLMNDPALYEEARKTVGEARGAIEDLREQAPVSAFGSLIFGAL